MDLPKILLTGLVFLVFCGFPRVFGQLGLGQQKPREKPNKPKKQKNQSWMDLPKILLTGLFFLFFFVFLEFLDSWAWDSKNLEKNQISQKNQKNQSWMDLPKILLTGLVFLFFWFSSSFWTVGLGTAKTSRKTKKNQSWMDLPKQKPREKPNKPKKKQKNQSWMDLPKILLTGLVFLFFLVFLEFLDSWAWDSKNLEKSQINQKNQKKTNPEWTYPRFFSQDCFFCFFWFSSSFWTVGLGAAKTSRKAKKNNPEWTYPRFFSQDCFFCFFLVFLDFLDIWKGGNEKGKKHENTKDAKTQRSQRPFLFIFDPQNSMWYGTGKPYKVMRK